MIGDVIRAVLVFAAAGALVIAFFEGGFLLCSLAGVIVGCSAVALER